MQTSKDQSYYQVSKFMTNLLRHREVGREEDAGVPYDRIVEEFKENLSEDSRYWSDKQKQDLKMAPHWSAQKWIDVLALGGGQKKRLQYCLKPDDPGTLLYLRAIQGHSGRAHSGNALVDPVLQDNVLLPKDFTKYVHHVGHGNELRSIVRSGLVPGGSSTKTGRCAVFFTVVDPMDDERGSRETCCDLSQARTAPCKNTWKPLQDTVFCSFTNQGLMQLYSMTLPAEFIGKAVCMKTEEQLYHRESARPRVVLKTNSQCESQDLSGQEARSSWETQKRDAELLGDRMQHCGLPNSRHISLNSSRAG